MSFAGFTLRCLELGQRGQVNHIRSLAVKSRMGVSRTEWEILFLLSFPSTLSPHNSFLAPDPRHLSLITTSCSVTEKIALDELRDDRDDHQLDVPLLSANIRVVDHVLSPQL